ncbi:hypothetical protein SAMN05519103_02762 [Rhizobiales bacterium GAS113]|nr:hypothetical protein SAMN05519103_02762 [Rhizobiales bacterium GAS113]
MSTAVESDDRSLALDTRSSSIFACLLFGAVICLRLAIQYFQNGDVYLEDDAYYYTVIARNIAQSGISSFDGQTLTNGYHPLWLLLLVAQNLLVGSSPYPTILIELALTIAGLWFFLASFSTSSALFKIAFAMIYTVLLWPMTAKGMEVSLLIFSLGLFTRVAVAQFRGGDHGIALGIATILCIGARLDAAVFVIPTLLLVSRSLRQALIPFALVGVAGAVYAGANLWLFGVPFPISGAIKSLGGLQWNEALLDQMSAYWRGVGVLKGSISFLNSFLGRPFVLFGLSAVAVLFTRPGWKSRPLCLGFLAGFVLFAVKLVAFSSWVVWPWYAFPSIIALTALFHVIDDALLAAPIDLHARRELIATIALALLFAGLQLRQGLAKADNSFEAVNLEAVAKFGPALHGARVAMGDRAGSFASHYAGPVTQLEGLVNDKAYFDLIQQHADIRPLLCRRGVRYVLSYQRDLGQYDKVSLTILRHPLTHFAGPVLTFQRSDEVGRVSDLSKYDNSAEDEGDNYLYLWRLSGCEAGG